MVLLGGQGCCRGHTTARAVGKQGRRIGTPAVSTAAAVGTAPAGCGCKKGGPPHWPPAQHPRPEGSRSSERACEAREWHGCEVICVEGGGGIEVQGWKGREAHRRRTAEE
jgi:hypothetical protein